MLLTGLNFHNREHKFSFPRILEHFQRNISSLTEADEKVAAKMGQLNRSTWEKGKASFKLSN